jgi:hypothetical protein
MGSMLAISSHTPTQSTQIGIPYWGLLLSFPRLR